MATHTALIYNLPALDPTGRMDDPDRAGQWESPADLGGLADSLKIGADAARLSEVKSIPDVWAQTQVFEQALMDEAHPNHHAAVAQWRGLLGLIALQPEFSTVYDLDIALIDLGDRKGEARRFRRVLHDLRPLSMLTGEAAWDKIGLLLFQERKADKASFHTRATATPLGILSPSVLVSAGKGAEQLACKGVPWMTAGLTDPSAARLSDRHLQILAAYAQSVAGELQAMRAELDNTLYEGLSKLLFDFHEACAGRIETRAPVKDVEVDLPWPSLLHRAVLSRTQTLNADAVAEDTDCQLMVRPEMERLFKGVILVDPQLAEKTLNRAPESITVWGRFSLADAANPATLAEIVEDAQSKGWLVVRPEDFFTHDLVMFDQATDIPAHGPSFSSALLPLSPLALLVMDPARLAEAAELSRRGGEDIVRLKLPMGGRAKALHTLERRYPSKGEFEERPEDLAIWPNFSDPDWHWNFLHFQYNPKYELKPRFAITADFIASEVLDVSRAPADRARRIHDWADPDSLIIETQRFDGRLSEIKTSAGLLLQRLRFADADGNVGELHRMPLGVEAVFFARHSDEGFETPVGFSLVRFPELRSTSNKATVAIDFGTTNTVVYEGLSDSNKPMEFDERILFPFRVKSREAERRDNLVEAYTSFFPLKRHQTPFPTVAKKREFLGALPSKLQTKLDAGRVDEHGYSDTIFFVPDFENFAAKFKQYTDENPYLLWTRTDVLKFNLKWGDTGEERGLSARFLRQIMMMAAAELRARGIQPLNIDWRLSFPQAFNRQQRRDLELSVRDGWNTLFGENDAPTPKGEFLRKTEGASAAHYFMMGRDAQELPTGKLMLMLDIGGGTTDIALWRDGHPCWRNSFKIAGGQFFTRYLANNFEILKRINLEDVAAGLTEHGEMSASARMNFVELFVNKPDFAERFEKGYPKFSPEPEGAGLRYCASVALGGLMHYVGLVLKRLEAEGAIEAADLEHLSVAFAGRGATLFRHFHREGDRKSHLNQLVKLAIASAGYDPEQVEIDVLFSRKNEAKHEVAKGLLIDADSPEDELKFAVLGEAMEGKGDKGDRELGVEDDLKALQGLKDFRDPDLAQLQAFLVGLRKLTGIGVDIGSREGMRAVKNKLRMTLMGELRKLKPEDFENDVQPVEPPFIIALRELVTLMSLPVGERDKFVEVTEQAK